MTACTDLRRLQFRRQFPATSYVTQEKLAGLLLASPEGQKAYVTALVGLYLPSHKILIHLRRL
jgi:hypothetical protein